eukprot:gene10951-14704_t
MFSSAKKHAKRLNCSKYRAVFSIRIDDLLLPSNFTLLDSSGSLLSLCFERGGRTCSTKDKSFDLNNVITEDGRKISIMETLELVGTLYRDNATGTIQKKKGKIILRQLKKNNIFGSEAYRGLGVCHLDLDKIASDAGLSMDENGEMEVSKRELLQIDLNGRYTAIIDVEISIAILQQEDDDSDTLSVGSIASDASEIGASFDPVAFDESMIDDTSRRKSQPRPKSTKRQSTGDASFFIKRYEMYQKTKSGGSNRRPSSVALNKENKRLSVGREDENDDDDYDDELDLSDIYSDSDADNVKPYKAKKETRMSIKQAAALHSRSSSFSEPKDQSAPSVIPSAMSLSSDNDPSHPSASNDNNNSKIDASPHKRVAPENEEVVLDHLIDKKFSKDENNDNNNSTGNNDNQSETDAPTDGSKPYHTNPNQSSIRKADKFKIRIIQAYKEDLKYFKRELTNRARIISKLEDDLQLLRENSTNQISGLRTEQIRLETLLRSERSGRESLMLTASGADNDAINKTLLAIRNENAKLTEEHAQSTAAFQALSENVFKLQGIADEARLAKKDETDAAQEAATVAVKACMRRAELELENQEILAELIDIKMRYANLAIEFDGERTRRFQAKKRLQVYAEKIASLEVMATKPGGLDLSRMSKHDVTSAMMNGRLSQYNSSPHNNHNNKNNNNHNLNYDQVTQVLQPK